MRCKFLLLFVTVFAANCLTAQVRLGGKIVDSETNLPITGATIKGSNGKSVISDVEGGFYLPVQKNSTIRISITSVGYNTKELDAIDIASDNMPTLTVSLDKITKQLEGVVVKTNAKRESVATLYTAQKISSAISDGISAEVIKKSPDRNTGEVLKRVSGTSIQDNKFVIIRGLSERYNVSMLNNSVLPSTEADKKAFSFDIIPSSVVDNIVVYKTPTADLPGDFAGGTIKVMTRDFPTKRLTEIGISLGANTLTTGKDFLKPMSRGKLDAIGFLDNSRLIPGPYYRHITSFINQTDAYKTAVTKMFPSNYGYVAANKSLPNAGISFTGGNTKFLSNNNKIGYIYALNYGIGRNVSNRTREEYDVTKRNLYTYDNINYEEKSNLSALLNLTYSYRNSKIALKNLFNNNFSNMISTRNGINYENSDNPFKVKGINNETSQAGLVNSVLEGVHKLGDTWNIDWNGSYAFAYKNQPDQKILNFVTNSTANNNYYIKLSNQNSPEIKNAGRVYSFLNENIYGASVNGQKVFQLFGFDQKFKVGTMNYYRSRTVEADAVGYATLGFAGVTIPETPNTNVTNIFSGNNVDQYQLTVANLSALSTNYTGNALMNAFYIMLDNKFTEKLKLTWGGRLERYDQKMMTAGRPTKNYLNNDFLPSVLFTYAITPKANIRLAASQAVNRPEFRELAPYRTYDYDNNWLIEGNPTLVRSKITSGDLRYELFPASGEILSASLFYKYFKNPIEQTNKGNEVLSYDNADLATAYGAEVEIRKRLSFTDNDILNRFMFYTNASYLIGNVQFNGINNNSPLQGLSPYLINAGLSYSTINDALSFNLLYNRVGPRLTYRAASGAALNIFEAARDVLDFQISKRFANNKLETKLTIGDIFAQSYKWYYKYDANAKNINYKTSQDKIIQQNRYGTNINLSLKYIF